MNNLVQIAFSILDVIKITSYQFCYDYVKLKYDDKAQFYLDMGSLIV